MNKILIVVFFNQVLMVANGQIYNEMSQLLGHLFNDSRYNKFLRPLHNQSHVMKVNVTQYLKRIEYFDISSGELAVSALFQVRWTDELLTWNPSLYGGKESIPLPKGKFWKPELTLGKCADYENSLIGNSGFSQAWVTYQGSVIMTPAGSYVTRCSVDTTLFPFDKHECEFELVVSNHDTSELMLYSPTNDLETKHLEANGEWKIEHTKATIVLLQDDNIKDYAIPMSYASFTLKRRPLFELINSYASILFMCTLNAFTCFVPPDSGERLSFAVTLYLSLAFATTAVIERIPSNSLKMPYISFFILTLNFINTVGVTWSIFVAHLAKIKGIRRQLPAYVVKMVMKRRQTRESKNKIMPYNRSDTDVENHENKYDIDKSRKIIREKEEKSEENICVNEITGLELATVLDKIDFVDVILFLLTLTIVYFTLIVSMSEIN